MKKISKSSKFERLFFACPGAWYGNPPTETAPGNITIDATRIGQAIPWLSKRAQILETRISRDSNPGLFVSYTWKA